MPKENKPILLNEILNLGNLDNVKIRFNLMFEGNWNPIEIFKHGNMKTLLEGQYWNYGNKKSFRYGQITVGFIRLNSDNLWLLFHVGRITKDLNRLDSVGYEYEELHEFDKYLGRLIVRFKNKSQNMIRLATSVMDQCEVDQILSDVFDDEIFPGYDQVNISWEELSRVVSKESWKTALRNQKGVYLLVDSSNGKKYVGSAYGDHMILGRWESYVKTGHGGNVELQELGFEYIKTNFRYSILDIFKSTTDDRIIIERENWWKRVLHSRKFGYNRN